VTIPALTTERLWLRAMLASDGDDLHVARGDAEAMRWWYSGVSPSVEATCDEIADMATWDTCWSFGEHGDETALGYIGFHGLGADEGCGFGYFVRRSHWGRGLTVEASRAVFAHGFDTVGIGHAELWIDPGNAQSQRVAEKLGATFRGWAPTGRLSVIWGITRDEWREGLVPPTTLNVVPVVGVSDMDRAVRLWCDGFGFRLAWAHGDVAHVLARWTGGPGVRLVRRRLVASVSMQVGVDVEALVARAASAGWVVTSVPQRQDWGSFDATLLDPDGNRVTVAGGFTD
jgi:ribosomal-protein-alanine N-acetyltransferase